MTGEPAVPGAKRRHGEALGWVQAPGGEPSALLLMRLGQRWFAMDARSIEEVALRGQVTRVPMAPNHILGVTSLRGRLVTVVSLEQMLGGSGMLPVEHSATLPRLVVVREGDYEMAVVAHGIFGLVQLSAVTLCGRSTAAPAFVCDEFDWQGGRVALLDVASLVGEAARLSGMRAPAEEALP
jgi:chemotaxis signal transduction protein